MIKKWDKLLFWIVMMSLHTSLLSAQTKVTFILERSQIQTWTFVIDLKITSNHSESVDLNMTFLENPSCVLKNGSYTVSYKSVYGSEIKLDFVVADEKKKEVAICIDQLNENEKYQNTSFLKNMDVGEYLKLNYYSGGCFHVEEDSLEIQRIEKGYQIIYAGENLILDEAQISFLESFEKVSLLGELSGNCTTVDRYTYLYRDKKTVITDTGCQFMGWYKLRGKILDR